MEEIKKKIGNKKVGKSFFFKVRNTKELGNLRKQEIGRCRKSEKVENQKKYEIRKKLEIRKSIK